MKRRDSLRTLLIGGVGAAGITTGVVSCKSDELTNDIVDNSTGKYGRIPKEIEHDELIKNQESVFSDHGLSTIAILCDLILPATPTAGSSTDAGVPEFIDFIVKDIPKYQLPLQGGLMWLDGESNTRFANVFTSLTNSQQEEILDDIAYPATEKTEQFAAGRKFFNTLRRLVLTGYYTTKMGVDDIGYVGNRANLWDGVPDDVLQKHGMQYDPSIKYIDHNTRDEAAQWDENANLIN